MMSNIGANNSPKVFIIGYNAKGEAGMGYTHEIKQLTELKTNNLITKIHPSYRYTIYTDDEFNNILVAGRNKYGQLGLNTNGEPITTLTPLTFFKDKNIKIKKICVSINASTTFFMTTNNEIYGCGENNFDKLGLENKTVPRPKCPENFESQNYLNDQHQPILISTLKDVIELRTSAYWSLALCSSNNVKLTTIINYWCRLYSIPDDITSLLLMYSKCSKVYSTIFNRRHGHGEFKPEQAEFLHFGWREIETLSDKNIIKIAAGYEHSLFLGADGVVYSCGWNADGLCGLDEDIWWHVKIPTPIVYFIKNGIRIVDISIGCLHSLVLDDQGRIYSFGHNNYRQCGVGDTRTVPVPKMIKSLKDFKVVEIKCGGNMSYCKTECGKNFLWGSNNSNECMEFGENNYYVSLPKQIDNIITKKCGKSIVSVYPGYQCTKLIVC